MGKGSRLICISLVPLLLISIKPEVTVAWVLIHPDARVFGIFGMNGPAMV